jgi:hypothetical protein
MLQAPTLPLPDPGLRSQIQSDPRHATFSATPGSATSLRVRLLNGEDMATIERHLLALDPVSRNTRFGSGFADSSMSNYVRRIDLRRAQLVGAVG